MLHDASTLERIVATISQRPQGENILVTVSFNADLDFPGGHKRNKAI